MKKQFNFGELEDTLLPWVNMSTKYFSYLILKTFKENGLDLSREQMMILKSLQDEDGQVQNDLAFITNRDKTSLTRIINNMEKKGLLSRVQCVEDHRCNKIFISPKGKAKYEIGFPLVQQTAKKMQKDLSESEVATTIKVLKKVLKNLSEQS